MPDGSFFGEMSLLESKPRSATIIACSDEVTVLEVSETDFSKLLLEAASITYRLLLTLNNRLNNMLDRIEPDDKRFVFKYKKNPIYTYNPFSKADDRITLNINRLRYYR